MLRKNIIALVLKIIYMFWYNNILSANVDNIK